MKYKCLRTCYVNDRLWKGGETYNLPDTMEKHPKNFEPLEGEIVKEKDYLIKPVVEEQEEEIFKCAECGKECKTKASLSNHVKTHRK